MFTNIKNNLSLYVIWLVMLLCISLGIVTTNMLSVVALIIFALYLLFSSTNNSCILLFGIMPFANIFKYSAGTTSFFTICELMIILVVLFREKKVKSTFFASLMLLTAYILVTDMPNFDLLGIIKLLIGFYLIHIMTSKSTKSDVVNIAYLLSSSTILMLLLSMNESYFQYVKPYLVDLNYLIDSSGSVTETVRLGGFFGDPNYCSIIILVSIALLCTLYYYKKIKVEFWFFVALLIPLGFFTYSKSYFLCISALSLFLILFVLLPKYKGWAIASLIVMAILVFMSLSGKFEIINVILTRFEFGDITTGRLSLNRDYLNYIWNNPITLFFGEGISAEKVESLGNNVHNIYIEALFKFGILGVAIYVATMYFGIDVTKINKEKIKFVNLFSIIFLAILYFALAGITMYEFPFYLSIAFLSISFNSMDEGDLKLVALKKEVKLL